MEEVKFYDEENIFFTGLRMIAIIGPEIMNPVHNTIRGMSGVSRP
jgi:hypothetical protein